MCKHISRTSMICFFILVTVLSDVHFRHVLCLFLFFMSAWYNIVCLCQFIFHLNVQYIFDIFQFFTRVLFLLNTASISLYLLCTSLLFIHSDHLSTRTVLTLRAKLNTIFILHICSYTIF